MPSEETKGREPQPLTETLKKHAGTLLSITQEKSNIIFHEYEIADNLFDLINRIQKAHDSGDTDFRLDKKTVKDAMKPRHTRKSNSTMLTTVMYTYDFLRKHFTTSTAEDDLLRTQIILRAKPEKAAELLRNSPAKVRELASANSRLTTAAHRINFKPLAETGERNSAHDLILGEGLQDGGIIDDTAIVEMNTFKIYAIIQEFLQDASDIAERTPQFMQLIHLLRSITLDSGQAAQNERCLIECSLLASTIAKTEDTQVAEKDIAERVNKQFPLTF